MIPPSVRRAERWETVLPGLAKKVAPVTPGPWFQYHDAAGFEWNTFEVSLQGLPDQLDGFRIFHLSDLHCRPYWQSAYDELIDRLNANEPDLIVVTGDIVDYIINPHLCLPTARRFLSQLRAHKGILGIRGNHDEFVEDDDFNGTPLRMIDGQRVVIQQADSAIELIAVPGPFRASRPNDFEKRMPPKQPGVPRIILSHYPDQIRKMRSLKADIFLSGHTHGGQICLPGGIPILRHDSLPMRYFHGVHQLHGTWFFVSRGFGFSTQAVRLFCPAEVTEIRLRK